MTSFNLNHFLTPNAITLRVQFSSVAQSCPTLCDLMDCSLPGSSVHGILQARILEWVTFPSPGDLPDPGFESGGQNIGASASASVLPVNIQG